MRPLAILVTGDPVETVGRRRGPFAELFRAALGEDGAGELLSFDARRGELPAPGQVAALIITGSAASVTSREPWMVASERGVARLVADGVPTLGVCFGHQLLAQALGGEVTQNPLGREMGTVSLSVVADDPWLSGLPERLDTNMSHRDSALRLPEGARVLGRTELEPHALVRFGERTVGMQFHPEFDGDVMRAYIEARREVLAVEGVAPDGLAARDAPLAVELLRRFVRSFRDLQP